MCVYMLHMPRLALHAHKYTSCEEVRRPAQASRVLSEPVQMGMHMS